MNQFSSILSFLLIFVTVSAMGYGERAKANQETGTAKIDKVPVSVDKIKSSTGREFPVIVRDVQLGHEITKDRAYFGAPPPYPHKRNDFSNCMQCHAKEDNLKKNHRALEPVPHKEYSQCLQCHVDGNNENAGPFKNRHIPFADNEFSGLDYPGRGNRAHNYCPPTIPHKTYMRDNCQACHGPSGHQVIRTPHPKRSQCMQCHVPEQAMDYSRPISKK